jgi:hypothetical protein
MDWIPRIVYGTTTLDLTWPQRHWTPSSVAVGGRDISATGVPAAYSVRRDQLLDVTIRFEEDEWPDIEAWLQWAQGQRPFTWHPDRSNLSASYTVYLQEPAMGEPILPERDEQFPLVFTVGVQLRRVGWAQAPFDNTYHFGT